MALILGIESSCDETAASVVEDATIIRSTVVASQLDTHLKYGGVVPELASREHLRAIVPVVREALSTAQVRPSDLSAIAVTEGPGLTGSLLVGITYAKTLCMVHRLPLIGVNHIEGHIHAVLLETRLASIAVEFPLLALVVSGGHTHLFEMHGDFDFSPDAPATTPLAKPLIRSQSCLASPIQAGRSSTNSPPTAIHGQFASRRPR